MKTSRLIVAAAIGASLLCSTANASLHVTPAGPGLLTTGNDNGQAQIDAAILAFFGFMPVEVYKNNVGSADEGTLASSYSTVFSNTPTDPSNFATTYGSGPFLGDPSYLLVKDGNQPWYFFNISAWDGISVLSGSGFYPAQGAISHITLYGPVGAVPEPGTVLVWAGLTGLAFGVVKITSKRRRRAILNA